MNYSYLDRKENFADSVGQVYAGRTKFPQSSYPIKDDYGNRFFCSDMGLPTESTTVWHNDKQYNGGSKIPLINPNPKGNASWGLPLCECVDKEDGGYLNCGVGWTKAGPANNKDRCDFSYSSGVGLSFNPNLITESSLRSQNSSKQIECAGSPPPPQPSCPPRGETCRIESPKCPPDDGNPTCIQPFIRDNNDPNNSCTCYGKDKDLDKLPKKYYCMYDGSCEGHTSVPYRRLLSNCSGSQGTSGFNTLPECKEKCKVDSGGC